MIAKPAPGTADGSAAAAGIGDERIVWLGFSQGACLASEFVARQARRWGGLIAAVGGRIHAPRQRADRRAADPGSRNERVRLITFVWSGRTGDQPVIFADRSWLQ